MTGEKDPRDVMQAEHDARLSEHPAFQAPAEMPGVEEIRDIIQTVVNQCTSEPTEWSDCVDDATAAILDLFAPILAENWRLRRWLEATEQRAHDIEVKANASASAINHLWSEAARLQKEGGMLDPYWVETVIAPARHRAAAIRAQQD